MYYSKAMGYVASTMRLCVALIILIAPTISAQDTTSIWGLPGGRSVPQFVTVGGDRGWNLVDDVTFFNTWSEANLNDVQLGDVLVFTSRPGTDHSVKVIATDQPASSSCGDHSIVAGTGRNHFTSNVSLVILQTNVTYLVTSTLSDCKQGLQFNFFVKPNPSQTYHVSRDVGVAYNLGYLALSTNTLVTSFGRLVPPQESAYIYEDPQHDRKFFNGDLLNIEVPGAYELEVLTNANSSATIADYGTAISYKGANNSVTYLVSVGLAGVTGQKAGFQHYYRIGFKVTGAGYSGASTVAAFSVKDDVTLADACPENPGTPYLCSKSHLTSYSGRLIGSFILLVVFLLAS